MTSPMLQQPKLLEMRNSQDKRGSFTKVFCSDDSQDLHMVDQVNIVRNPHLGTIRGLHFQKSPFTEVKKIMVLHGSIFDVVIDLRPHSKTFLKISTFVIRANEMKSLFIPAGFAHGYQTLESSVEVLYLHTGHHEPIAESGINHADTILQHLWPIPVTYVSNRDSKLPRLKEVLDAL